MFAHPIPKVVPEIAEVSRLIRAGGEAIERNEQVCNEFSHIAPVADVFFTVSSNEAQHIQIEKPSTQQVLTAISPAS